MSWAARRRLFILLIIGAVIVAFLAVVLIATFAKAPSCTDGVQNQDEQGADCGGSCTYLCTADLQPPTVLFTQAISNGEGRTDIAASVENKNVAAAAKRVPYRIQLYNIKQTLIQEIPGTLDLPPGGVVSVFMPGVYASTSAVASAFLTIDPAAPQWVATASDPRIVPVVSNVRQSGVVNAPRVEAVLTNQSITTLVNVQAIVVVRNEKGDVIAASRTIVPSIPAQGQALATFTWNGPFADVPASIEVEPVIPLP